MEFDFLKKYINTQTSITFVATLILCFLSDIFSFCGKESWSIMLKENKIATWVLIAFLWFVLIMYTKCKKHKSKLKLNPNKATVLVAFSTDDSSESKKFRNDLYARMKQVASNEGFNKYAEYVYIDDESILKNIVTLDDIKKIHTDVKARFVIGGRLEMQTIKGKDYFIFPNIGIGYVTDVKNIAPNGSIFANFFMPIAKDETFINLSILSENLNLFINCILSFSLVFSKNFLESKNLLTVLYNNSKNFQNTPQKNAIRYMIVDLLLRTIAKTLSKEYCNIILPSLALIPPIPKVFEQLETIEFCENEQFSRITDSFNHKQTIESFMGYLYHQKAILLFAVNNIKSSVEYVKKAKSLSKNNARLNNSYELSLAFLYMWRRGKGDYKLAVSKYKKAFNQKIEKETALAIKLFIKYVINNATDRKDLLFISAIMTHFSNPEEIRDSWQLFKDENEESQENKVLFDFADYCLKAYHTSKMKSRNI